MSEKRLTEQEKFLKKIKEEEKRKDVLRQNSAQNDIKRQAAIKAEREKEKAAMQEAERAANIEARKRQLAESKERMKRDSSAAPQNAMNIRSEEGRKKQLAASKEKMKTDTRTTTGAGYNAASVSVKSNSSMYEGSGRKAQLEESKRKTHQERWEQEAKENKKKADAEKRKNLLKYNNFEGGIPVEDTGFDIEGYKNNYSNMAVKNAEAMSAKLKEEAAKIQEEIKYSENRHSAYFANKLYDKANAEKERKTELERRLSNINGQLKEYDKIMGTTGMQRAANAVKGIGKSTEAAFGVLAETAENALKDYIANAQKEDVMELRREKLDKGSDPMLQALPETEKRIAEIDRQLAEKEQRTAVDVNSRAMQNYRNAISYTEQATKGLEGGAKVLADTAISVADNAALLPFAIISPSLPLALMSVKAAAGKAYELNERGISSGESIFRAIGSGAIEAATEKIPLDNLSNMVKTGGKSFIRNMLTQAGIEGTEEGISYIGNYILDKAAKDEEATFSLQELAMSVLEGGLSGLFFGVGGGTASAVMGNSASGKVNPGAEYYGDMNIVQGQDGSENVFKTGAVNNYLPTASGEMKPVGYMEIRNEVQTSDARKARNLLSANVDEIKTYVTNAFKKNNRNSYLKVSDVSNKLSERLLSVGIDVRGYAHVLSDNDIRHIENSHGSMSNDKYQVNADDYGRITDITENYDSLYQGYDTKMGNKTVVYEKRYDNKVFYVEEVLNDGVLATKQMVKTGLERKPSFLKKYKKISSNSDTDVAEFNQLNEPKDSPGNHVQDAESAAYSNIIPNDGGNINGELGDSSGEALRMTQRNSSGEALKMTQDKGEFTPERQVKYREIVGRYAGEKTISNMDTIAKRLGSEVIYFVGDENTEGYYENGKIYINANLIEPEREIIRYAENEEGKTNSGVNYWKVFKHEFTHAIEDSESFKDFKKWALASGLYDDFVKGEGFVDEEGRADKAAYAESIRELYKRNGESLDGDGLNRELVAKFVQKSDLFENEESIRTLVGENRSLGQRILDWIRTTFTKINGVDPTAENILKEAERLYVKALEETGKANEGKRQFGFGGKKRYYDYSKSFSEQIDDYKNGLIPQYDTLIVGRTPEVLKKIGFNDLPITINQAHVEYMLNNTKDADHFIGEANVKKLPELIENPIAVIKSKTHGNDSVVMLVDMQHNGKQVITPIYIDGYGTSNNLSIDANAAGSTFAKGNAISNLLKTAVMTHSKANPQIFYLDTKKAAGLLRTAGLQLPGHSFLSGGYIANITDKNANINMRFENVTQTQQFKNWFGDWESGNRNNKNVSKVTDSDGKPKKLYHQTGTEIEEFDTSIKGSGYYDSGTPEGIFLKTTSKDIGLEGKNQIEVYADIKNPLEVENRRALKTWAQVDEKYKNVMEEIEKINAEYSEKINKLEEESDRLYEENYYNADNEKADKAYQSIEEEIEKLQKEWEEKENKASRRARERLTERIKKENYDGVHIKNDEGSYGRNVETWIAFDSRQVKSTDNIGLFDKNNPKIKYSFKQTNQEIGESRMNAKAQSRINKAVNKLAEVFENGNKNELKAELRDFVNAYVEKGGMSSSEIDEVFDRLYGGGKAENIRKKNVRAAFDSSLMEANESLNEVMRYNKERAKTEEAKAERRKTVEELRNNPKDAEKLFKESKKLNRELTKLKNRYLWTETDGNALARVLRGEIAINELPKEVNRTAVEAVYETAKAAYETDKRLKDYKKGVIEQRRDLARDVTRNSNKYNDKHKGIQFETETPERNFEDVAKETEDGKKLVETYIKPIHDNEAKSVRMKNELREKLRGLKLGTELKYHVRTVDADGNPIDTDVSESGLVQMYGEGIVSIMDLKRLRADSEKIKNAAETYREVYNYLLEESNKVLVRNGYAPVGYRKNYFPHFVETKPDSIMGKICALMGIDIGEEDIRTDIAGITENFRPGKKWVGNFLERKGNITDYDAMKGFDRYIDSVSDVIWHTDDIQNLRALSTELRYKYSDEGMQQKIADILANDVMDEETKTQEIRESLEDIKGHPLNNFVTWLDNYTNLLAGKKHYIDRPGEKLNSRRMYQVMKGIEGRVQANMVGANISSALTNFIPITQVSGMTSNVNIMKAIGDTIKGTAKEDNLWLKSSFLTNRKGTDVLYRDDSTVIKKAGNIAADLTAVPFEAVDGFTSEVVYRSLYYDALKKGMSESSALDYADNWAARVMADRSKGATPTIFSAKSPFVKLFTMFQVEVNNQYRYFFKDIPREKKEKGIAALAAAYFKMFLGAYLYNEFYEMFFGRRAAFDPAGKINKAQSYFTGKKLKNIFEIMGQVIEGKFDPLKEVQKKEVGSAMVSTAKDIAEDMPFIGGLLGGGRVPISGAMPDVATMAEVGFSDASYKKKVQTVGKEVLKPLYYIAMPMGGGQVKKFAEGIYTVEKGGDYTYDNEGNAKLKYPVERTAGKALQAMIGGKSSLKEAQEYYDSGLSSLSAKQTQNYHTIVEAGIDYKTFTKWRMRLSGGKKSNEEKREMLFDDSELTAKQKAVLDNFFINDGFYMPKEVDVDYGSKESFVTSQMNSTAQGGWGEAKKAGFTAEEYKNAMEKISEQNFESDKDSNGKSIGAGTKAEKDGKGESASLKKKKYIDSLGLSQKKREALYEAAGVSEKVW